MPDVHDHDEGGERRSDAPGADPTLSVGSAVGTAIRTARTAAGLSMRALAAAADVSQPFISQVESGSISPSLITLYRIAAALGITPNELLPAVGSPSTVHVVRSGEGEPVVVSEAPNAATGRLISSGAGRRLIVAEYRVEPGQDLGESFVSAGEMTVYVVTGSLAVSLEGRGSWTLGPGDAITHPGAVRNTWRVVGDEPVTVLLAYAPTGRPEA